MIDAGPDHHPRAWADFICGTMLYIYRGIDALYLFYLSRQRILWYEYFLSHVVAIVRFIKSISVGPLSSLAQTEYKSRANS